MVLRLLFVLLIALNIAVGAWLWLGQDDTHQRSATDPDTPSLHLLSERPAGAGTAPAGAGTAPAGAVTASSVAPMPSPVASAPASASTPQAPTVATAASARANANPNSHVYTCIAIGPFSTPLDMRNARSALVNLSVRTRSRQEQTTQSRGWWVYLPASPSRDQALAQARKLSAANIKDYFVVGSNSGDQPNTVSLGLFKDPANARKRRDEVVAAGFSAQMTERTETVPEYWLDLAVADNAHFDWRSRIRNQNVGSHSTGCF
ncbi:SPOR domain-containing protein [Dyella sp.]|uniref:SPOR domain-containing protein n=1 Tax=Dyella sp. TaxID=1869338 RepID=UPI002ED046B7